MKDKLKRRKIDWYRLRLNLKNPEVDIHFYQLVKKHPASSWNRLSYNALRFVFGDRKLLHYRLTGEWL